LADLAPEHYPVQIGEFQKASAAQVRVVIKAREVLGINRHHHHPAEAAVGTGYTQGHRDLDTARDTAEHRQTDEQRILRVIALRLKERPVGIVHLARGLTATDDIALLIHDTDDGEHGFPNDLPFGPLPQVYARTFFQVLFAHESGDLFRCLQGPKHLLLESNRQVRI